MNQTTDRPAQMLEDFASCAEPSPLSLDEIARLLSEMGVEDVRVEMTGGGCATLYAGRVAAPRREGEDWDRALLMVGPGWFEGPGYANARISVVAGGDCSYGPDDDGESEARFLTPPDMGDVSEAWVANAFFAFIHRADRIVIDEPEIPEDASVPMSVENVPLTDPREVSVDEAVVATERDPEVVAAVCDVLRGAKAAFAGGGAAGLFRYTKAA